MRLLFNVIKAVNQVDTFPLELVLELGKDSSSGLSDGGKTKPGDNGHSTINEPSNNHSDNGSNKEYSGVTTVKDQKTYVNKQDDVIRQAKAEAKSIIERARDKGEQIKERGYDEGYKSGQEEGYGNGVEQGLKEAETWIKKGIAVYEEMQELSKRLEKDNHQIMIKLALEIAKRVVKKEVLNDEEIIVRTISDALSKADRPKQVSIRVNPKELAVIDGSRPLLEPLLSGVSHFKVEPDPEINVGGCIIDTEQGAIDARIESQINAIDNVLVDYMEGVLFDGPDS